MHLRDLGKSPHILRSRLFREGFDLTALSNDSRQVDGATAFFALAGLVEDGHAYLDGALAAGAPVVFVSSSEAFERLAQLGTKAGVNGQAIRIHVPLISMSKADIVREGVRLKVDFGLTHSCYDPTANGLACGQCDSCLLRLRGFADAGRSDPLPYARNL